MEFVTTPYSIHSKGHYSPAVIHNDTVYISGQLPIDYENGKTVPSGTIEEQTLQALNNLADILTRCGSGTSQVLKTTIYIPDIGYWPAVNKVYSQFFADHKPARTIVPTNNLHYNALIEIDAIACIK